MRKLSEGFANTVTYTIKMRLRGVGVNHYHNFKAFFIASPEKATRYEIELRGMRRIINVQQLVQEI